MKSSEIINYLEDNDLADIEELKKNSQEILDAYLEKDKFARVACETVAGKWPGGQTRPDHNSGHLPDW